LSVPSERPRSFATASRGHSIEKMLRNLLWLLVFLSVGWISACYLAISRATDFWSANTVASPPSSYWHSKLLEFTFPILRQFVFAWLFLALLTGVLTCAVTLYHLVKASVTNVDLEHCRCPKFSLVGASTYLCELVSPSCYRQITRTRICGASPRCIHHCHACGNDPTLALRTWFHQNQLPPVCRIHDGVRLFARSIPIRYRQAPNTEPSLSLWSVFFVSGFPHIRVGPSCPSQMLFNLLVTYSCMRSSCT
jgi:hypothetical protein